MGLLLRPFTSYVLALAISWIASASGNNQTPDVSPIFPGTELPFRISIKLEKNQDDTPFLLPDGLQSYAFAILGSKWLFINGRTNGLHGFGDNPDNFPPRAQNRKVYVVDIKSKKIASRSLEIPESGLTQDQIDSLSVTASLFYQKGETLYIAGGYGFRNSDEQFVTFDTFTAIDVPGLIHWVTHPSKDESLE
jgi:hypothetical protein